jgi:hypothetical protein
LWLIVVIGENGIYAQLKRQSRYALIGGLMQHDQAGGRLRMLGAQGLQALVQLSDGRVNEFNPTVHPRQGVQYRAVIDKNAVHLSTRLKRMVKCCVIAGAQIAPEPDQAGKVFFIHGGMVTKAP